MIRLPLLALLLLAASPALALKCLAPDPARDFRAAEADSATWSGVYGWLEVLSHPEGAGTGQARLTGRSLTTEGFSQPFDRDIALQVSCLGPWCGQVESGPVAALLRHGRALALHDGVANAQALLATWFLGSETGHALADIMFGKVDPSAKLPVSFPWESGQEPFFYDRKSTGRPTVDNGSTEYKARYATTDNSARFPFGHGLSYTDFALSDLKLSDTALRWDGAVEITARLTNKGKRKGSEVVQLYIRDRVASRTRPIRELKRIQRVTLSPGDSTQVRFTLSRTDLEFVGAGNRRIAEPGLFDLWVGQSSTGGLHGQFTLYAAAPTSPPPKG